MRVLVVQLSDIHIRKTENSVLSKRGAIKDAVRNLDPAPQCCILLLSGDIAQSGSDVEYSIAYDFIEGLKGDLTRELVGKPPVYVVAIPGNHDCDLRANSAARDLMRDALVATQPSSVDNSVVDTCTDVQRSFFELSRTVSDESLIHRSGKLYYEYRIPVAERYVEIRCLNTAWLSQRHESPGTLFIPAGVVPERNPDASLSITMLHHPFHWLPVANRRQIQPKVEQVSDVIFTGHEHAHTRRTQTVSTGEVNEFIEGAALQVGDDSNESSFNVLVFDIDQAQQRFFRFEWDGNSYAPTVRGDWEPFQVNRLRARTDFELNATFAEQLEDPGAGLEKLGFGRPKLSDIFVYPELRELALQRTDIAPTVASEEILEESLGTPHLLISGPEQCGKTCLAKVLFLRLKAKGFVPIYVDGSVFAPQTDSRLHEQLYRLFSSQYEPVGLEKFRQLERGRRVLIVDGFHKVRVKPGRAESLLRDLESFAGRVILFTNDLAHAVGEIVRARQIIEQQPSYRHFGVLPFGYSKRTELTTKWLMLPGELDEEDLARRLTDAEERMEVVLGKNFVPAFPIFILSMLQGLDSETNIDTNASTYGYFYELLVKAALVRGATQAEFNIRLTYLTRLAYRMFQVGRRDITESELRSFHEEYERTTDLPIEFGAFITELERRLILVHFSDIYEFKYGYCYYYFVARALHRQIAKPDIRTEIARLSEQLDDEENANILLFLAHLTDDEFVIRHMIASAMQHFKDAPVATLDGDIEPLERLEGQPIEFEYEDRDFYEVRKEVAVRKDELRRVEVPADAVGSRDDTSVVHHEIRALTAAIKSLQILGQTLKNFPALDANLKEEIAVACYKLGFRALGHTLGMLKAGEKEIVEFAIAAIRAEDPEADTEKVLRRANSVVFGLALAASYGIVKRVSQAVGSPHIAATYRRVADVMPTTATELVNLSIRLDQLRGFPQGDIIRFAEALRGRSLSRSVLTWLVWTHVTLFPVRYDEKQKVFSALGIKYLPGIGAKLGNRLLGPGRGEA